MIDYSFLAGKATHVPTTQSQTAWWRNNRHVLPFRWTYIDNWHMIWSSGGKELNKESHMTTSLKFYLVKCHYRLLINLMDSFYKSMSVSRLSFKVEFIEVIHWSYSITRWNSHTFLCYIDSQSWEQPAGTCFRVFSLSISLSARNNKNRIIIHVNSVDECHYHYCYSWR